MQYLDILEKHLIVKGGGVKLDLSYDFFTPHTPVIELYEYVIHYAKGVDPKLYEKLIQSEGEEARKNLNLIKLAAIEKVYENLKSLIVSKEFQEALWEKLHIDGFYDKSIFVFIDPNNIEKHTDRIFMYIKYNAIVDIRDIIDEVGELCDGERENLVYNIQEHVKDSVKETIKMFEEEIFEPLPLIEAGDSRFISLATYYLHEPHIGSFQP